jgi:hypothetical protein
MYISGCVGLTVQLLAARCDRVLPDCTVSGPTSWWSSKKWRPVWLLQPLPRTIIMNWYKLQASLTDVP